MKQAIALYIPVLHQGYLNLFDRYPAADVCIFSKGCIESIDPVLAEKLTRALYAIDPSWIVGILHRNLQFRRVNLIHDLDELKDYNEIVLVEDDFCDVLTSKLNGVKLLFDSSFLRYDWKRATAVKTVEADAEITYDELHQCFMLLAVEAAKKSSDWWRQVGVVVSCTDGKVLTGYNRHMPHTELVNILGDPRSSLNPGELPDVCTAIHGETSVIAQAAKSKDISLEGASVYVTTFPCPVCARILAESDIKTVYFQEGYSRLDALEILKAKGIKVVKVVQNKIP